MYGAIITIVDIPMIVSPTLREFDWCGMNSRQLVSSLGSQVTGGKLSSHWPSMLNITVIGYGKAELWRLKTPIKVLSANNQIWQVNVDL